jgi:DNA-binding NtrC family response regulator
MARTRPHHDLNRLLENWEKPVYAVDEQGRLVFLNQATAQWAGISAEELAGQSCHYHSGANLPAPAAAACRLCPPPVAMSGVETEAEVSLAAADGPLMRRLVRFIPLRAVNQEVLGVLALAGEQLPHDPQPLETQSATPAGKLHEHIQRLRHRFRQRYYPDRLLGQSPAMDRVRAQIVLASASLASVLVVGPRGSGREHVARAIHSAGPQSSSEPLVPLACSLVGGELLRSTLAALLRDSAGGRSHATLLLNDIDELAPAYQADLPSLLGAAEGKLRIISTSRTPLLTLADRGVFLTLPAHQLSTILIELPPLAQRLDDLALLAQVFLEQVNARGGKQVGRFSEEGLDALAAFPWTNDLDELEQVVIDAHRECQTAEITLTDLPRAVQQARQAAAHTARPEETINLEEFLARIELELIERALSRAKGNKTKAAQLLGLNRPRLYRRLVQLGLAEAEEPGDTPDASSKGRATDET